MAEHIKLIEEGDGSEEEPEPSSSYYIPNQIETLNKEFIQLSKRQYRSFLFAALQKPVGDFVRHRRRPITEALQEVRFRR